MYTDTWDSDQDPESCETHESSVKRHQASSGLYITESRAEQHGHSFLVTVKHAAWNYSRACHVFSPHVFYGTASSSVFARIVRNGPRNPVVSMISNSGMWNGMLFYEAQIPDTYLFAHSSLLDDL